MKPISTRRPPRTLFLVLLLAAATAPALAEDADLSGRIRERMHRFVNDEEITGAVTVVGRADGVDSLVAVGRRDVENDLPMRPDTLFRIASITKPITALGIFLLVDEGKLKVDDLVETHLPEFRDQRMVAGKSGDAVTLKKPSRPITLRDLLTHTSGLPDSPTPGAPDTLAGKNPTLAEAVAAFGQRPLGFEPGSRWAYSNAGITTLGRIIEVVSGRPFETFMKERLFDPLGMSDTTFYPTAEQMTRTATTYDRKEGVLRPVAASKSAPVKGVKYPSPAGGLYSTAPDLVKLCQCMLNRGVSGGRRYLSESSWAEMTRVQTGEIRTGFTDGMGYGFGWGVVRKPAGVTSALSPGSFGHGGAWGTQAWIDPVTGRFVVLLIQRVGLPNSDASAVRAEFQRIALKPGG